MKTNNLIEGLQILCKYRTKGFDGYDLGAEHDVICAYPTNRPLQPHDLARMIELGWFQKVPRDHEGGFFTESDYKPDEGWEAFA